MAGMLRAAGLVLIAIIAVVFLAQNLATIEVAFLTWSATAPRAVIFLLIFVLGLVAGYLAHALRRRRPIEAKRDADASDFVSRAEGGDPGDMRR